MFQWCVRAWLPACKTRPKDLDFQYQYDLDLQFQLSGLCWRASHEAKLQVNWPQWPLDSIVNKAIWSIRVLEEISLTNTNLLRTKWLQGGQVYHTQLDLPAFCFLLLSLNDKTFDSFSWFLARGIILFDVLTHQVCTVCQGVSAETVLTNISGHIVLSAYADRMCVSWMRLNEW